jgi:hypothetical protein
MRSPKSPLHTDMLDASMTAEPLIHPSPLAWALALLLSSGCQASTSPPPASTETTPPASTAAPTPDIDEPPAATDEQPTPTSVTWQFTSLVTGGAEGFENLIGANGFYELELVGDSATLRKVGQKGTPRLPDAEILSGSATLVLASNAQWPSATRHALDIELSGNGKTRRLALDLWFLGDEVHGTWVSPSDKHEGKAGDSWGLVQGRRGTGEPLVLENGANTPCMVCSQAFFNCDSGFFDAPACNSADTSRSECEQKLERARNANAELPRGCGDYFL